MVSWFPYRRSICFAAGPDRATSLLFRTSFQLHTRQRPAKTSDVRCDTPQLPEWNGSNFKYLLFSYKNDPSPEVQARFQELVARCAAPDFLIGELTVGIRGRILRQDRKPHFPGLVAKHMRSTGLAVVPFAPADSEALRILTNQMNFATLPLLPPNEEERRCWERLRFDLLVFAAALRHQRILITCNTRDFTLFPHSDCWVTPERAPP